jgi:hypothetical protein
MDNHRHRRASPRAAARWLWGDDTYLAIPRARRRPRSALPTTRRSGPAQPTNADRWTLAGEDIRLRPRSLKLPARTEFESCK